MILSHSLSVSSYFLFHSLEKYWRETSCRCSLGIFLSVKKSSGRRDRVAYSLPSIKFNPIDKAYKTGIPFTFLKTLSPHINLFPKEQLRHVNLLSPYKIAFKNIDLKAPLALMSFNEIGVLTMSPVKYSFNSDSKSEYEAMA